MTTHSMSLSAPTAPTRMLAWVAMAARRVMAVIEAYRQRRDVRLLASFDDRMLQDIGLTRSDLRDAVAEPFWRNPTAVLVRRAGERRRGGRGLRGPVQDRDTVARGLSVVTAGSAPLAPTIDAWSSSQFPARSRYY